MHHGSSSIPRIIQGDDAARTGVAVELMTVSGYANTVFFHAHVSVIFSVYRPTGVV
jgi:hypothetical protein